MKIKLRTISLLLLINIVFAYPNTIFGQTSKQQNASVTIKPGNLTITTPDNFDFGAMYLNPGQDLQSVKILDPTVSTQRLTVVDSTVYQQFRITVDIGNFVNSENNSYTIPNSYVDLLTLTENFNNVSGVDTINGAAADTKGVTGKNTCAVNFQDYTTNPENIITPCSGKWVNGSTNSINIMEGLADQSRIGTYSLGFAFRFRIPQDQIDNIKPGNYTSIITFTKYQI